MKNNKKNPRSKRILNNEQLKIEKTKKSSSQIKLPKKSEEVDTD